MKKTSTTIILLAIACMLCSNKASGRTGGTQTDYLNSIKITFLSWFTGSTKVSYERAFPEIKQSGEICAGVISAGYDKYHNDPLGFTVRYGHKFFIGKDKLSLKGFYLRPEAVYSYYFYERKNGSRELADMGVLLGTVGYQYVYKRFLADVWVGGGYAVGHAAETKYHHGFALWHWFNTTNDKIALSFSIRLGICF
ncbi:MAG: hypothetical protein IJ394_00465 [Bacteroidales bacterium]|nr:hypothetical protein [Bacteroidales bacterium]